MSSSPQRTNWGPILAMGSLWGLTEAALGVTLRQCASNVSGSIMTGTALFFLAAAWKKMGNAGVRKVQSADLAA